MIPSSAELTYFLEVANTSNFSRAAERLGLSQPSLSLAIKRLEEAVGATLFIRHKQGVNLTQAGKQLAIHARQLLHYWENTKAKALASTQEVQGYFRLGCPSSIAIYLVSTFLPALLMEYPKLEIQLKHDISRKITEKVISLSIDLGIVINPLKHPDLIITKLGDDEVTLWESCNTLHAQSESKPLWCDPSLMQTQLLLKELKQNNRLPERILTTNSLEVIASLVVEGHAIGILPTRVANILQPNKLKKIADAPHFKDEICLIYRHENRTVQAIQTMVDTIKRSV